MFGLIGTAIGISIMARVATGVCRSMERPYSNNNYRRYNNNYRKNPYKQPQQRLPLQHEQKQPQQPQQSQTHQQRLPLQHKQKQPQQPQKPRYNSFSCKPRYSYKPKSNDKNRKQPYWKMKVI